MARAEAYILAMTVTSAHYPTIAERTADFAYLRCKNLVAEEPTGYLPKELKRIAGLCREWGEQGEVYAFMINGAKERAPAAALALARELEAHR